MVKTDPSSRWVLLSCNVLANDQHDSPQGHPLISDLPHLSGPRPAVYRNQDRRRVFHCLFYRILTLSSSHGLEITLPQAPSNHKCCNSILHFMLRPRGPSDTTPVDGHAEISIPDPPVPHPTLHGNPEPHIDFSRHPKTSLVLASRLGSLELDTNQPTHAVPCRPARKFNGAGTEEIPWVSTVYTCSWRRTRVISDPPAQTLHPLSNQPCWPIPVLIEEHGPRARPLVIVLKPRYASWKWANAIATCLRLQASWRWSNAIAAAITIRFSSAAGMTIALAHFLLIDGRNRHTNPP